MDFKSCVGAGRALARPNGEWRTTLVHGLAALALVVAVSAEASAQQPAKASAPLVFDGVTVVDVEQGKLLPDSRVVVSGNRIQEVGPVSTVSVPKGADVVDGRGNYLIPGLWDMHIHVRTEPELAYPLLVANGITGVRQMSELGPWEWRRDIIAGKRVGPRVVASADIEGATVEDGQKNIDRAKAEGADFAKVHNVDGMAPNVYFGIAAYARKIGMPLVGHLPNSITEVEASDSGQRTVEHFNEIHCWWPDGERGMKRSRNPSTYPSPDSAGIARCTEMARTFARNGTWLVPTLTVTDMITPKAAPHAMYWPQSAREELISAAGTNCCPGDPTPERGREVIGLLHRAGIPLLAGTDVAPPELPLAYGFSLHDELKLLVNAGLSPLEALRTATVNPAKFLRATDSLGTVAAGKVADLVLLEADPLSDIDNTNKIRAVIANGRYFDRVVLDKLLADVQTQAQETR